MKPQSSQDNFRVRAKYHFVCRDRHGRLKWTEDLFNVVTTAGKNDLLDKYFAGSGYTAAWYIGLIDAAGFTAVAAGNTMASHSGWTELTAYDESTREAAAWNAASSGSKSTDGTAVFTFNATKTVKGAFLASNATKNGTSGVLYNAVAFSSDRAVEDDDTLTVTLTFGV